MLFPKEDPSLVNGKPELPDVKALPILSPTSAFFPSLDRPQAAVTENPRSIIEVDALLASKGFPEMNRSWEKFKSLKINPESLKEQELFRERQIHCSPFGARPALMKAALVATSIAAGLLYAAPYIESMQIEGVLPQLGTQLIGIANMAFITLFAVTSFRRRVLSNMEDRMAKELAYMLTKPNFRGAFESQDRTKATDIKLRSSGFSTLWDNPSWNILYTRDKDTLEKMSVVPCELTMASIKAVLGSKDTEQRQFTPGRFFTSLINGKQTINQILSRYGSNLKTIKDGTASSEFCIETLKEISTTFLIDESAGKKHLDSTIKVLEGGLGQGEWKACIWKRDPLVDLTHQDEFYSSASLRGTKAIGRGIKGRLGTFLYHWNRSITMLDISSAKGRVVRVRLLAVTAKSKGGQVSPHILVDGVEGTTAVRREVIQRAVEDYGAAVGAQSLLYNAFAHNQVPKRFGQFIKKQGVPLVRASVTAVDLSERQYLDSFGLPLEPFEYSFPKGNVIALQREMFKESDRFPPASKFSILMQSIRRNILWIFSGQAVGLASFASFQVSPAMGISMLTFGACGLATNALFQRRSLNK